MALVTVFTWSVFFINQTLTTVRDDFRSAGYWLRHHLPQLLEEVEWCGQKLNKLPSRVPFFADFHQWQFWVFAGSLVVLSLLCRWCWKRSHGPGNSRKQDRSRSLESEEEDPLDMDRVLDDYTSWPLPYRHTCTIVEGLVNDLIGICQGLSQNDVKPRLQPAVGVCRYLDRWTVDEVDVVYQLLVPLKPPSGHSFLLQEGIKGDMPVRNSCLQVELTCTCRKQRFRSDMLCFLHNPKAKLMIEQKASLLQTLCTGSYLDMQKTYLWLQELMRAACTIVCQSVACKITVLPFTRSCRLKLDNGNDIPFYIELTLALQQDLGTFISLE